MNKAIEQEREEIRKLLRQQDTETRRYSKNEDGKTKEQRLKRHRAKLRLVRIRSELRVHWRKLRRFKKKQAEAEAAKAEARSKPRKIVEWFEDHEGFTENPAGSNCGGHKITASQHFLGYDWACRNGGEGVFWCGCTAGYALIKIGGAKIPNKIRLGYNGYIEADARAKANGLRAISAGNASIGCLATMRYPHIVTILSGPDGAGYVKTGEGNTSPTNAGSQSNGGCYAIKRHHISEFTVVAEVAGIHFDK